MQNFLLLSPLVIVANTYWSWTSRATPSAYVGEEAQDWVLPFDRSLPQLGEGLWRSGQAIATNGFGGGLGNGDRWVEGGGRLNRSQWFLWEEGRWLADGSGVGEE